MTIIQIGIYVTEELKDTIRKYAFKNKITQSEVIRQALEAFFKNHKG